MEGKTKKPVQIKDPLDLPGFRKSKAYLEENGYPSDWIVKVVNLSEKGSVFIKDGKPWNKSDCPYYKGFWLCGSIGSVDCIACSQLLPGLMWQHVCKENFEECPILKEFNSSISDIEQMEDGFSE